MSTGRAAVEVGISGVWRREGALRLVGMSGTPGTPATDGGLGTERSSLADRSCWVPGRVDVPGRPWVVEPCRPVVRLGICWTLSIPGTS